MIRFSAVPSKISTTRDGGWQVVFDIPDSEKHQIFQLSAFKDSCVRLEVIPEEVISLPELPDMDLSDG